MRITHVIRGDDHISNTPKQVLLYRALGSATPAFAHVPLILGPDKKRLSKRHGATSVMEYQRLGYLPEAMVNFLALLGWSPGGDQELFSRDELISKFTLEGISGGNAVFNPEKLDWVNQQHIQRLSAEELVRQLEPVLRAEGLWKEEFDSAGRDWLLALVTLFKPRIKRLDQFAQEARPLLDDVIDYDGAAVEKHLKPDVLDALGELATVLERNSEFTAASLETALRGFAESRQMKPAPLIHATRVAVTGRAASPGLFETLELAGRDRVVTRLRRAIAKVSSSG
jgi:glutamyl-tRNA synthetase